MYAAEEMTSCNWSLPQGSHGKLLGSNDTNLDSDQLEETFHFQYACMTLLRSLLLEQAPVKILDVACPSVSWINIFSCNSFGMRISYLAASTFTEECYA